MESWAGCIYRFPFAETFAKFEEGLQLGCVRSRVHQRAFVD